jgi:hypothetical protein
MPFGSGDSRAEGGLGATHYYCRRRGRQGPLQLFVVEAGGTQNPKSPYLMYWRLGRGIVLFAQTIIFAFTYHIPNFPFSPSMSLLGTTVINSIV